MPCEQRRLAGTLNLDFHGLDRSRISISMLDLIVPSCGGVEKEYINKHSNRLCKLAFIDAQSDDNQPLYGNLD